VIDSTIRTAAHKIRDAVSLVVLTGAGVSRESNVPTFRDAFDGYWSRFDPQQLATPAAFKADPSLVWRWYQYRRNVVEQAKPNPGHYALADLEDILPQVTIITQNVDGLHQCAGSTDVNPLHGDIRSYKCFNNCQGDPTPIDITALQWDNQSGPPHCPHCGGFVRPDVVWFTERLNFDLLERANRLSAACDVMLVIGTSGLVRPAASMPYLAKRNNAFIIDINPNEDEIKPLADLFIQGQSSKVLPAIIDEIRRSR
jgi:NAD-dependent deacetylase